MSRARFHTVATVATLASFTLMLVASCNLFDSEDRAPVVLSTNRLEYASDESPVLHLFNGTGAPIGYNLCSAILEVQRDRVWQAFEIQQDVFCADVLNGLTPGETATYEFVPSEPPPPGRYRFTLGIERDGAGVWLASPLFRFTEGSAQVTSLDP
jgi:hypothetical protein